MKRLPGCGSSDWMSARAARSSAGEQDRRLQSRASSCFASSGRQSSLTSCRARAMRSVGSGEASVAALPDGAPWAEAVRCEASARSCCRCSS